MDRGGIRVLVVGGGVGSLAVAAFLKQSGYRVWRLEDDVPRSEAVVVAHNGARMLSLLGPDVLARGTVSTATAVRDHRGELASEEKHEATTTIARADLESSLRAAVPGIEACEAPLKAISEKGVVDDRAFHLVVGADGPRSRVRALAFPDAKVTDAPFSVVSFTSESASAAGKSGRILGDGATAIHTPLGARQFVRAVVSSPSPEIDLASVQSALGPAATPLFDGMLRDTLRIERLVSSPSPRWSSGAVLLVGGALHPLHPLLDQDPAMTFEDGRALQVALDRSENVAAAIAAFEQMRKARVAAVHASSWDLAKAGEKRSGFGASFRSVLHKIAPSLWPKQASSFASDQSLDELVTHRPDLTPMTTEAREFLSFLVKIGQVDGRFDEAERAFVRSSLQESGHFASEQQIATIEDEVRRRMPREIVAPFKSRSLELREHLLHAGVLLAAASGRIASDEHKALREAAHALDLPDGFLGKLVADVIARS
jgi:salicylate hydroxylase